MIKYENEVIDAPVEISYEEIVTLNSKFKHLITHSSNYQSQFYTKSFNPDREKSIDSCVFGDGTH